MKIIKKIAIGIIVLILLVIITSIFLPSKVHVERSVKIISKPSVAFDFVNDLKKWNEWSPWYKLDTTTKWTYSDNAQGDGAWYTWKGNKPEIGEGKLLVTQSKPFSLIECEMNFGPMGISMITFQFDSIDSGTKVTWSMNGEGKGIAWYYYVMSKYFNLVMDKNLGPLFENGLQNLKTISEAVPQKETVAGFDVEEKVLDKLTVLSIRESVVNTEIGMKIGKNYSIIGQYMSKTKVKETGSPLIILHTMAVDKSEIEFAIPVDSTAKSNGKISYSEIPSTNAIVIKYYGDYGKTATVYKAANKYIESKRKKLSGPPREIYITDPGIEKDTSKWLTEIVFPIE